METAAEDWAARAKVQLPPAPTGLPNPQLATCLQTTGADYEKFLHKCHPRARIRAVRGQTAARRRAPPERAQLLKETGEEIRTSLSAPRPARLPGSRAQG